MSEEVGRGLTNRGRHIGQMGTPVGGRLRYGVQSGGFDDQIGVGHGVAGPDESDGVRHTFFEFTVRFEREWDACQVGRQRPLSCLVVVLAEFLRGVDLANGEVRPERIEHLEHGGNVVDQRNVDRLDPWPEGKAAVGDDEGVMCRTPASRLRTAGLRMPVLSMAKRGELNTCPRARRKTSAGEQRSGSRST